MKMKRVLCILFAVLFTFSAFGLTAFASDDECGVAAQASFDKNAVLHLEHGETFTLNYLKLVNGTNVAVPKGGHVEWGWQTEGGTIGATSTADHKNCTVEGHHGGRAILLALVYNAKGDVVSSDGVEIDVAYTGLAKALNTLTFGLYHSARVSLYNLLSKLDMLIWNTDV